MFDTHTIARTGVIVGALVSIVVAVVLNLTAEDVFPRQDDGLFQARTIECRWVEGTSADWDNGELSTEDGPFGEDAQIIFDEIDLQARTTRIGGQISPVIQTAEGITFIESTTLENLNFTTVFRWSVVPQQYLAVTSRHMAFNGPSPSQYYGSCTIVQ